MPSTPHCTRAAVPSPMCGESMEKVHTKGMVLSSLSSRGLPWPVPRFGIAGGIRPTAVPGEGADLFLPLAGIRDSTARRLLGRTRDCPRPLQRPGASGGSSIPAEPFWEVGLGPPLPPLLRDPAQQRPREAVQRHVVESRSDREALARDRMLLHKALVNQREQVGRQRLV
mmetsp:Transcript_29012/g.69330  ORF Transcript_29012/g.69330 Transcript_29012/m.69330 type:complete len:170 (+) Transcript_29012:261-770(+)